MSEELFRGLPGELFGKLSGELLGELFGELFCKKLLVKEMLSPRARRLLLFAVVAALVFACDRWSKNIVLDSDWHIAPLVVNDFLRLVSARNDGVAFGMFAGAGETGVWFFSALAVILSCVLAYWVARANNAAEAPATGLMAGGALGNACDRITHGYVVDFIDAHITTHHWPAFNIADAAITLGALCLIITILRAN